MKTAVIVSGILREMDNAMPTWAFDADYFLVVQDTYQAPRNTTQTTSILPELAKYQDKFTAIAVVDKLMAEFEHSTTLTNQTWKWKVAYNLVKPYIDKENYDRFIVIRPDSYLNIFGNIDEIAIEPNVLHGTSQITLDTMGHLFANDTILVCGKDVFQTLGNFYDYIEPISHTLGIHQHFANFLKANNIKVTDELIHRLQTVQLRSEMRTMFENNLLKDKYSVNDLFKVLWEQNSV